MLILTACSKAQEKAGERIRSLEATLKEHGLSHVAKEREMVERLEAKADSAEAFVDGPICAFFGFLKPNAIRNAEKAKIPVMAVIGAKEVEADSLNIRTRQSGEVGSVTVEKVLAILTTAISDYSDWQVAATACGL